MKKTIVFDLDGTLLNTIGDLADAVNYGLETCGFPGRTLEEVTAFVGNGVANLIERSIPGGRESKDYDNVFKAFRAYYSENYMNKTVPYAGITEMLARLCAAGYKMAVVSNKYDAAVKALIEHFFGDYIGVAIGETAGLRRKPEPDTVDKALHLLDSGRDEAVYIGDSEVDVKTARNCKMPCIIVTWGYRSRKQLAALEPDAMADSVEELERLLEK